MARRREVCSRGARRGGAHASNTDCAGVERPGGAARGRRAERSRGPHLAMRERHSIEEARVMLESVVVRGAVLGCFVAAAASVFGACSGAGRGASTTEGGGGNGGNGGADA